MIAQSDTILGRARNQAAWEKRQRHNNKWTRNRWGFTVSVYTSHAAKSGVRYSDPVETRASGQNVIYRIRVYPKRTNGDT